MRTKNQSLLTYLHERFPDAGCALNFQSDLEYLVAISLSAQTTDVSVNKVTPSLFKAFPDAKHYADAPLEAIEDQIRSLGLYRNKAKNLKALGIALCELYDGVVPHSFEDLVKLPGVGTKTAGVFLLERGDRPAIPVDTHVKRISVRLGYAKKEDEPIQIEAKLEKTFPREEWKFVHHSLIWFGREVCHAQGPKCDECPLHDYCSFFKKTSSTTAK